MAPTGTAVVSTGYFRIVTSSSNPALATSSKIPTTDMMSTQPNVQSSDARMGGPGDYGMGSNTSATRPAPLRESLDSFCDFNSIDNQTFLFGGIGIGLAIILAFTTQRVRLRLDILRGRPGLLIPVNLLDGRSHRHVYVMAFCSMTVQVIQLVFRSFTGSSSNPWTKTLVSIAYVLLYSGGFSIVVMSIEPPHRFIGYSLGLIYSLFTAAYRLPWHFSCDTSGFGAATDVLLALPLLCIVYVVVWFAYRLVREVLLLTGRVSKSTLHDDPPYHVEYVKKTLARSGTAPQSKEAPWIVRFIKKYVYKPDPTFKYSTRILVTVAVSAIAIWELTVITSSAAFIIHDAAQEAENVLDESSDTSTSRPATEMPTTVSPSRTEGPTVYPCDKEIYQRILRNQEDTTCEYGNNTVYIKYSGIVILQCPSSDPACPKSSAAGNQPMAQPVNGTNDNANNEDSGGGGSKITEILLDFVKLLVDAIPICLGFAIACSTFLTGIHLPHVLSCYRKHMKRLYRGEKYFLPKKLPGPVGLVTSSLKYSGLQIGYVLWGWVILLFLLFITFLIIAICLHYKFVSFKDIFLKFLPTIVFTIILIVGQFLLAKFVFLKERGQYLGINNRRLFHLFSYFLFFYNTLVGVFSCLKRLIMGLALGTVMIDRLDRSTLPRGWESFDKGYKSYVGFLLMEHAFCNPYLVTFIYLLQQATTQQSQQTEVELRGSYVNSDKFVRYRSRRSRNRWLVAYTLINNPSLLASRRIDRSEHCKLITRSISKSSSTTVEVDMSDGLLDSEYTKVTS